MSPTKPEGVRYEIAIDGTPRTHRDRRDYAHDAAALLKTNLPHSEVTIRDVDRQGDGDQASLEHLTISFGPASPAENHDWRQTAMEKAPADVRPGLSSNEGPGQEGSIRAALNLYFFAKTTL